MDNKQQLQEYQYNFPYHYIPSWRGNYFYPIKYWSWGYRYIGGIQVVLDQLKKISFESLVDVGCGDGRFLREVRNFYPDIKLLGVDYSERAVRLARCMSPTIAYRVVDITKESLSLSDRFDVATLIEVLEHIPPNKVDAFLRGVAGVIKPDGYLILTVPHVNKPVSEKHYQHFSSGSLRILLRKYFSSIMLIPFDAKSVILSIIYHVLGGSGKYFLVTNARLWTFMFNVYRTHYLYPRSEKNCLRIAAACRK